MLCPNCRNTMRERERGGVYVDVCPGCRGFWMEAGELEKLIENERRYYELIDADRYRPRFSEDDFGVVELRRPDERPRVEHFSCRGDELKPKKRRSFLSNVFEAFVGED